MTLAGFDSIPRSIGMILEFLRAKDFLERYMTFQPPWKCPTDISTHTKAPKNTLPIFAVSVCFSSFGHTLSSAFGSPSHLFPKKSIKEEKNCTSNIFSWV